MTGILSQVLATVPPIPELERICGGEGRGSEEPLNVRFAYARLVRRLSIRITWLMLHTRITADQATLLGISIGLGGAALLAVNNIWVVAGGIFALQLSFVLDFSDGEIARFHGSTHAGGAYLDWVGHYYIPAAVVAALTYSTWRASGHDWLLLAALVIILGMVRVAYSARDHILLGLYRDHDNLRQDPELIRAVLARQGGDPGAIDIDADAERRRQGGKGAGLLWHRFTNLGQLLVFPGFVNLVMLAAVVDALTSLARGDYPNLYAGGGRQVLLGVLGLVQLLHQLRAAGQSYSILRRLR